MTEKTKPQPWRRHTCRNDHAWRAAVVFSKYTVNLSGEATPTCPTCGERARMSEPWTLESGEAYPFNDVFPMERS